MNLRGREITLNPGNLESLIQARLTGEITTGLPAVGPEEEPVDIFVDLAETDKYWREQLQVAAARLLNSQVQDFRPEQWYNTVFLGELCYLAARIGSTAALKPLGTLAGNIKATGLVSPGEDLRLRALRAYVGLLGAVDYPESEADREMLTRALSEPRLAMVALAGLMGVWPKESPQFLERFPASAEHGELLDLSINLAFPSRNSPFTRSR